MSEFDEWAERFERLPATDWRKERPPICMFPMNEGPHKVACQEEAHHRSNDGYPVCRYHTRMPVRPAWRGYIEGA